MPQEIEVRYIIPAIRGEFARILVREKKYSQKDAAKFLDLTEAAISQYLSEKRGKEIAFGSDVVGEIRKSVGKLSRKHSKHALIRELYRISSLPAVRQLLCDIHRTKSEELAGCSVCFDSKSAQLKI